MSEVSEVNVEMLKEWEGVIKEVTSGGNIERELLLLRDCSQLDYT